jgi:hypothetical protein
MTTQPSGFEEAWADVAPQGVDQEVNWFVDFWEKLVEVLPD